jgi:hypothetical protein
VGIKGIGLGLHRPARAGESKRPKALRHEAPCPHGAAGGQEMVRPLGTQPVGHGEREGAVGVPHVTDAHLPGQSRELVHDHLGLCGGHRLGDRVRVESVSHDGLRSQRLQPILLRRGPGHPDHLVASRHELRDERSAENACGAGYEDLHDCFSRLIYL